jgi:hypothetical protein
VECDIVDDTRVRRSEIEDIRYREDVLDIANRACEKTTGKQMPVVLSRLPDLRIDAAVIGAVRYYAQQGFTPVACHPGENGLDEEK